MTKRTLAATAATIFAVSTFAAAAHAQVACSGANACKGQSACKSASSACKGQNACKGQGFVMTGSSIECTVIKSQVVRTAVVAGVPKDAGQSPVIHGLCDSTLRYILLPPAPATTGQVQHREK